MANLYFIITIGCQMNRADSERWSSFLEKNNFTEAADIKKASLIIINTCGIRQSAEDRAYGLVNQIRKSNKSAKLVITGCLSLRKDVKQRLGRQVDLLLSASAMTDLFKLLDQTISASKLSLDEVRLLQGEKYLTILPKYQSKFSAFLPIGNGCNNFCSYCVVPYARGREVYRPAANILKEVKRLVDNGYKEIILIAQNVNSYQSGLYNFARLLEEVAKIKGNFWIRFSSSHPKDVSDELIGVIGKYDKICSHFHLALQSGDDKILQAMNRKYSVSYFVKLVDKIRKARLQIAITTDVIVGFPGETKKQFNNTVKIFKQLEFDLAYISRYSPRPQTASSKMVDSVSLSEKKERDLKLNEILKKVALKINKKYVSSVVKVLIEGINKHGNYYGKASNYKNVVIRGDYQAIEKNIGNFVAVKIEQAGFFNLTGSLV